MTKIFRLTIFLLTSVLFLTVKGQTNFPVNVQGSTTFPVPVQLADYANPALNPIRLNLQLRDLQLGSRNVRLAVTIQGGGLTITSTPAAQQVSFTLPAGVIQQVNPALLANYFRPEYLSASPNIYSNPLRAGFYTFSFEVYDIQTNAVLSNRFSLPPIWVQINQPPVLILPRDQSEIAVTQVQNVLLQWNPRHTQLNDVNYEFTLTELPQGNVGNFQNVFFSQPPTYQGTVEGNSLLYGPQFPPLREGMRYAWRVQAKTKPGRERQVGAFENNGYSEVYMFRYINPMSPPENITTRWSDDYKYLMVNWKGKPNHANYKLRFKPKGGSWIEKEVTASTFSNSYATKLEGLDPESGYNFDIIAADAFDREQKASGKVTKIAQEIVAARLEKDVSIEGTVSWNFRDSEGEEVGGEILTNNEGRRSERSFRLSDRKGSESNPLKGATVKLYTAKNEVNEGIDGYKQSKTSLQLVESVETDSEGKFTIASLKIELLKNAKHFYLYADFPSKAFAPVFKKVTVEESSSEVRTVDEVNLLANTVRLDLKAVVANGSLTKNDFEEIGLYRLASIKERNEFLAFEAQAQAVSGEVTYNGSSYVKVAELTASSEVHRLFGNHLFNDNFVVQFKQKGKDEQIVPLNAVRYEGEEERSSVEVQDFVSYRIPPSTIKGLVAYGNESKNRPLADYDVKISGGSSPKRVQRGYNQSISYRQVVKYRTVRLPWASISIPYRAYEQVITRTPRFETVYEDSWTPVVKTGQDGRYEVDIPANIGKGNTSGNLKVIVSKPTGYGTKTKDFENNGKNQVHDFYFSAKGATVAGVLVDQFDRPVVGATISHPDAENIKSNSKGAFVIDFTDGQAITNNPTLTVRADGYKKTEVNVSEFGAATNDKVNETDNDGYDFYSSTISALGDTLQLSELFSQSGYEKTFTAFNSKVEKVYTSPRIAVKSRQRQVLVKAYLKNNDKEYVAAKFNLDGNQVNVTTNGYSFITAKSELTFSLTKQESDRLFVPDDFTVAIGEDYGATDTLKLEFQLEEGFKLKGVVLDSIGPGNMKPLAGVSVNLKGKTEKVTSADNGHFELIGKKGNEEVVVLTKKGFNTERISMAEKIVWKTVGEVISGKEPRHDFMMVERDSIIPEFNKILGFDITVEKAVKVNNDVFAISGTLKLPKNGIFQPVTEELRFKDIKVTADEETPTNAVPTTDEVLFEELEMEAKLHGYAPVTIGGNADFQPQLRLLPLNADGEDATGKIGGSEIMFTPEKILDADGGTWGDVALVALDEQSKKPLKEEDEFGGELIPAFVGDGKSIIQTGKNALYGLKFDEDDKTTLGRNSKEDKEKYFSFLAGPGLGIFSIDVDREKAYLTADGIELEGGTLQFSKVVGFGLKKPLKIEKLVIGQGLDLESIEFAVAENEKLAEGGFAGKWRFDLTSLQIQNNFKQYAIGGKVYTDKDNFFIVNSLKLIAFDDMFSPNVSISFPEEGFKVKKIVLKNEEGGETSIGYDRKENVFKIDATAKIELDPSVTSKIAKKIFPLEVQRFVYSTAGEFFVSVKADASIKLGPAKINVRRVLFSRGSDLTFEEMNGFLAMDEEEEEKFTNSEPNEVANLFADEEDAAEANRKERQDNLINNTDQEEADPADVVLDDVQTSWAFGFAGGVQIEKLKGAEVKGDVSFLIGEVNNKFDYRLNEIAIFIDAPAYEANAKIALSLEGDKIGFEGNGDVTTMKKKFGMGLKFYKLPKGIEFGIRIVSTTSIATGSIMWSSIGGAIDLNTQENTYGVSFLGSAYPTGSRPEVTEFRNIRVSVLFDVNKCGGVPVVEGTMDWYNKGDKYCNIFARLDFCRKTLLATVDCEKEIIKGSMAKLKATAFFTTSSAFFGANIKTKVLGFSVNGRIIFGLNAQFNDADTPQEVKNWGRFIPREFKSNTGYRYDQRQAVLTGNGMVARTGFTGIFVEAGIRTEKAASKRVWIVSASGKTIVDLYARFIVRFDNANFELYVSTTFEVAAKICLNSRCLYAEGGFALSARGGYTNPKGWYFNASASISLKAYNGGGKDMGCNRLWVKWCDGFGVPYPCGTKKFGVRWCKKRIPYPCGAKFKICVGISGSVRYQQRGYGSGFKVGI